METKKPKISIIDDDEDIVEVTKTFLKRRGFDVITAPNGEMGLELIRKETPDLVLLDLMLPGIDGYEVCRRVKQDSQLWHIPVMYFTAKGEFSDKIMGLKNGADDYITKPFEPEELLARIWTILNRTANVLNANPLSKLPGNDVIQKQVALRLERKGKFAMGQIDVDRFKSFNDEYGFERGDRAIQSLAVILSDVIKEKGEPTDFVGHIGGDDFIVLSEPKHIDLLCEEIVRRFDASAPLLYDEKDRKRGYIVLKDRQGIMQEFPLISLSIAIVTNEKRKLEHIGEVNNIAAELKKYAKTLPGSNIVRDRRDSENSNQQSADYSAAGLKEVASLFQNEKMSLLFQPIVQAPENKRIGYESVLRGLNKERLLSQEELFNCSIELKLEKELAKIYFDKLRIFTYSLQKTDWVIFWIHPKVLLMVLENSSVFFKNFSDINLLIVQIKAHHFLRYEKLLKDILARVKSIPLRISISLTWETPFPITLLSEIRPSSLYLNSSFIDKIDQDTIQQTTLKMFNEIARALGSSLIVSGVHSDVQFQKLKEFEISLMEGPFFYGQEIQSQI